MLTRHSFLWPVFLLCHWLSAGFFAWHLLAQVDFLYPAAYHWLDIESHIAEFGPQNRHRQDFAETSAAQHKALFAEINHAIHSAPATLDTISYTTASGQTHSLLHRDEILHLKDVARLIDGVYWLGVVALSLTLLTGAGLWRGRAAFPRARVVASGTLLLIASVGAVVLIIGPKQVFYHLHVWIFPPDHPWFFYYQDSLMTTLMKAPDLFGVIALILLALWLLLWGLSLWLLVRYWPRNPRPVRP